MLCARAILGTSSIASAVIPAFASDSTKASSLRESSVAAKTAPFRIASISASLGLPTCRITSAAPATSRSVAATVAPAAVYASSGKPAAVPAFCCTETS